VEKKDNERTLCFEVALDANKTQVKTAVEKLVQSEGHGSPDCHVRRKVAAPGTVLGLPLDVEKAYVKLKKGEKTPDFAEI